jgi:hypothetical protein
METNDYLTQILNALNQWLSARDVRFTEKNLLFVRDDAVEYEAAKRRVHQEQMVTAERFSDAFASLLAGGPSWIHANAVPFGDGWFLITLAAGRKIGNPQPSINVSYEPEKQAEIILTKTLVTAN